MEIKAFKRTVGFRQVREGEIGNSLGEISRLDYALRERSKGKDYVAFAIPGPTKRGILCDGFNPQPYSAEVVLTYPGNVSVDFSRLYSDWQSLDVRNLLMDGTLGVSEESRHGDESIQLNFWGKDHCLMDPLTVFYSNNRASLEEQQNELIVMGTGNPGKRVLDSIESLAKSEGASLEIRASRLSAREGQPRLYSIDVDTGTSYNMRAPEINLKMGWAGEDFDRKGIHLFSEARKLLYPNHVKAIKSHVGELVKYAYEDIQGGLTMNHESMNQKFIGGDIVARLSAKVPFVSGDEALIANLFYHHFRGR